MAESDPPRRRLSDRARRAWPDEMRPEPDVSPVHTHRIPGSVRAALVGIVAVLALLIVAVVLIGLAVYQADQYVKGRGEYRDREAARMEAETEERIRQSLCDLMDELPEGGQLERPRAKYGCGPGIPRPTEGAAP